MMRTSWLRAAAVALVAVAAPPAGLPAQTRPVAFINANVVPMDAERVLESHTVVVRDGWITEVGPGSRIRVPADAVVVDSRGRYLMPGLAEMHGHIPRQDGQDAEDILFLYVAAGAITVRGMQGHPSQIELRRRIHRGEIVGPRLHLSSPAMSGRGVPDAATARRLVQQYRDAGFDLIKVHEGLSPGTYAEIVRTARQEGLAWGGHVADAVGLEGVIEAGQATIDHMDNFLQETGGDEAAVRALARRARAGGVAVVPTMALWEVLRGAHESGDLLNRPELRYMPRGTLRSWADDVDRRRRGTSDAEARRVVEGRNRILRILHEEGVEILMGTDAPQLFSVPGFSLHRELRVMADVGMSPFEILRTGTVAVARHFGDADRAGTVAQGMRADLVLLERNPLEDIAHVQQIAGVMVGGRWLSGQAIAERLEAVAERAAGDAGAPDSP